MNQTHPGNHFEIARAAVRLHRAGWTLDYAAGPGPAGAPVWVVTAVRREQRIRAQATTAAEAWRRALEAAMSLGPLGR